MTFHPLPIISILIVISAVWSIASTIYYNYNANRESFEFSLLAFFSILNFIGFLSGFSIGVLFLTIAFPIEFFFTFLAKNIKMEFGFSAIVSILLILFTQGFPITRTLLIVILILMALWQGWKSRFWIKGQHVSPSAIVMLGCLFGCSLLISYEIAPAILFTSIILNIVLLARRKQYLWQYLIILLCNILWLLNITVFS